MIVIRGFQLRLALSGLLASAALASGQGSATNTARLVGVIRDDRGAPVPNARATVNTVGGLIVSNDSGRFAFDSLPAGDATVEVRALGFMPVRAPVRLVADSTVSVELHFIQRVQVLSEVNVRARRYNRDMMDFERRRRMGFGHFITPEALARRAPNRLAFVVAHLPGTTLECPRGTECAILFRRMGGMPGMATSAMCRPSIYIDGRLDRAGMALEMFSDRIAAIEVYPRAATRPAEFAGNNHQCGAIAVWTDPLYLEIGMSADAAAMERCSARVSWCYVRQWWPFAALVGSGVALLLAN